MAFSFQFAGNHWDDVIAKYKEVELSSQLYSPPPHIQTIFTRIQSLIEVALDRSESKIEFMAPHIIDLAKEGHIGEQYSHFLATILILLFPRRQHLTWTA